MPAPIEAARPTRNAFHGVVGRERRREHRRERRHRTVHQADEAGLDDLQDEPPALVLLFAVADGLGQQFLLEAGGDLVVLLLGLGEVAEQLADRGVGCARQGLPVEAGRGALHFARVRAHGLEAQGPHLPHRLRRDIAADVLPPNQRNMFAEIRCEEIDEPAPVNVLLRRHLVEHFGAVRVVVVQAVGEIGVDAQVLLLIADGEREDLAFGQIGEIAHDDVLEIPASLIVWRGVRRYANGSAWGAAAPY